MLQRGRRTKDVKNDEDAGRRGEGVARAEIRAVKQRDDSEIVSQK
jgi:hypothetical protein